MSIVSFVELLPDEDFRSVVFRYHRRSLNNSFYQTKKELFGQSNPNNNLIPANLQVFLNNMMGPIRFDISEVLKHTWINLIKAFLPSWKQQKLQDLILYNKSPNSIFAFTPNGVFSESISYCPKCIIEDEHKWGSIYLHLSHQIVFMDFCPIHQIRLIDKCASCSHSLSNRFTSNLLTSSMCPTCNTPLENEVHFYEAPITSLKIDVFKEFTQINNSGCNLSGELFKSKFMMRLWDLNYFSFSGHFTKEKFINDFIVYYSEEVLQAFGISLKMINTTYFKANLFSVNHFFMQITFYVLCIRMLFGSIDNLIAYNQPFANEVPFGNGPWPCRNRFCEHYQRNVISKCKRELKLSGGTTLSHSFVCPTCGYTYSRRWKKGMNVDRKPGVIELGHIWKQKVLELHLKGASIRTIARKAGCDNGTIRKHLECMQPLYIDSLQAINTKSLNEISSIFNEVAASKPIDVGSSVKEKIMLVAIEKGIESRNLLRQLCLNEYRWIKINDPNWLDIHFPMSRRGQTMQDYSEYELDLIYRIKKVKQELIVSHPRQIKKSTILNRLNSKDRNRLSYRKMYQLCNAREALQLAAETIDEYLIRKINLNKEKLFIKVRREIEIKDIEQLSPLFDRCEVTTKEIIKKMVSKFNEERKHLL
jgi:hypothetical protein